MVNIVVLAEASDDLAGGVAAAVEALALNTRVDALSGDAGTALDWDHLTAEVSTMLGRAHILVGPPDRLARAIPHCPELQWVQSTWAGVAPVLAQPRRDFTLTALKGVFGQAMSEYLLAWLLTFERNVLTHASARHWNPINPGGLAGKRLGIMGTGSIGTVVASTLSALGVNVVGLNSDGAPAPGFERCYPLSDRLQFACGLDYLFAGLPETPLTNELIDAPLLHSMNPGAIVVNVGRGNVINDQDLVAALDSGWLRGAVLDVFRQEPLANDHPFWSQPKLYVTCHTAAPTETDAAVGVFMENLTRFVRGESLLHRVSFDKGY